MTQTSKRASGLEEEHLYSQSNEAEQGQAHAAARTGRNSLSRGQIDRTAEVRAFHECVIKSSTNHQRTPTVRTSEVGTSQI